MTGTDNKFDIDLPHHELLEPPCRAYTDVTVRRAFIVWLYCGQKNNFQHVCNYYHHLEEMEDKMTPQDRAMSRHYEFDIFTNEPPTSKYLNRNFPNLYSDRHVDSAYVRRIESIKNEKCIFKLEGFNEFLKWTDVSSKEVDEASKIIRNYCSSQNIPLKKFLNEFKDYADKCKLDCTVSTVVKYIRRKMLQAEIDIIYKMPKTFDFLEKVNDRFDEIYIMRETVKPKSRKLKKGFSAKDIKLNPACAAFFNSFNERYFENKSGSCSPLVVSNKTIYYNVNNNKTKSQSVESLFEKFRSKYQDSNYFKTSLMNINEVSKIRKI